MKRGNIRTNKKYTTDDDGNKVIKYVIQGRIKQKGGRWQDVAEKANKYSKKSIPLIFDTQKEAEDKLLEIEKEIRRR